MPATGLKPHRGLSARKEATECHAAIACKNGLREFSDYLGEYRVVVGVSIEDVHKTHALTAICHCTDGREYEARMLGPSTEPEMVEALRDEVRRAMGHTMIRTELYVRHGKAAISD